MHLSVHITALTKLHQLVYFNFQMEDFIEWISEV